MKDILVLGIESSCDETSVAVVKNGRELLSNVIYTQIPIHEKYGGVVPEIASRNHIEAITRVTKKALEEADVTFHHQAQGGLAANLKNVTQKYNNQVFMSTHNVEFLKTFLIGMGKEDPEFLRNHVRVVTLRNYRNSVKQRTLHGFEALEAINNGLELRT